MYQWHTLGSIAALRRFHTQHLFLYGTSHTLPHGATATASRRPFLLSFCHSLTFMFLLQLQTPLEANRRVVRLPQDCHWQPRIH